MEEEAALAPPQATRVDDEMLEALAEEAEKAARGFGSGPGEQGPAPAADEATGPAGSMAQPYVSTFEELAAPVSYAKAEPVMVQTMLPDGESLAFTPPGEDGTRLFLRRRAGGWGSGAPPTAGLLARPIAELRKEVDEMDTPAPIALPRARAEGEKATAMLTTKYFPTHPTQLLSDGRINREVLTWLKVFTPNPVPAAQLADWLQVRSEVPQMILLGGPPGVGKSTLASIAAKHAGFRPVEVNASDERSAAKLLERVDSVCKTQSVLGAAPQMLILDEIDGGTGGEDGGGGLNALARLLEKKNHGLSRPIIGLCNDLFAPKLKALRHACKYFQLPPVEPTAMQRRLRTICEKESIAVDSGALQKLAQESKGDLRTALNALQTLQQTHRGQRVPTAAVEQYVTVDAARDARETEQELMETIFRQSRKRKKEDVQQLVGALPTMGQDFPKYSELLDETLFVAKFSDPTLRKICTAHGYLAEADAAHELCFSRGIHDCNKYLLQAAVLYAHKHCPATDKLNLHTMRETKNHL